MNGNTMFKMISGELVIAEIVEQTDLEVQVRNPLIIHFSPSPNGQLGINLFPLNPFASETKEIVNLNSNHIIFYVKDVNDDIEKEYMRITTGITVAKEIPKIEIPN